MLYCPSCKEKTPHVMDTLQYKGMAGKSSVSARCAQCQKFRAGFVGHNEVPEEHKERVMKEIGQYEAPPRKPRSKSQDENASPNVEPGTAAPKKRSSSRKRPATKKAPVGVIDAAEPLGPTMDIEPGAAA